MTPQFYSFLTAIQFWLTSTHRRWRNPTLPYFRFLIFWLTSPHRRWLYRNQSHFQQNPDFDSHLLTGDDHEPRLLPYCQHTDFDSHLLTGDDFCILSVSKRLVYFDSHLLTGDDSFHIQYLSLCEEFWLTSPHRRWRLWFIYSTTLVWILTHISSPEMTLFFDTFPLFCTFWLTSPHRRWHYGGLWGSGDFYDFDSHLLTGDDVCDAALFYCQEWFWLTSPHRRWLWQPLRQQFPMSDFDSHLLTGDDSTRSWLIPVRLILTHISSPEMTNLWKIHSKEGLNFDSHLLTGDDVVANIQ